MNPLDKLIQQQIAQHGAMDVGQFMAMALGHPEHGYYMKQDPFGRSGDFVTAPEVSQMFGEILGDWAAHSWMQMGTPSECILLECGPGRGTLMADMMRATRNVPGFHEACSVHLLEMSPALKAKQAERLGAYEPQWHDNLQSLPEGVPIITVANEFLDALPFRQLIYSGGWQERVIDVQDDAFVFSTRPCPKVLWPQFGKPKEGDMYEFSMPRRSFIEQLSARMVETNGAAIFIDYGHGRSAFGDTFQAIKGHEYADVLDNVGDADLTSHVDFEPLYAIAEKVGVHFQPMMEQGAFLKALGIDARAAYLSGKANEEQGMKIEKDLHRLTDRDEMGSVFKVMDLRYGF
jgi:SAM-dependent MidA family methyltransferase